MPPIIVPNVARYTVNQSIGGQVVANVLDMHVVSNDPLVDREQALYDVAGDILNNWDDHIAVMQTRDLNLLSVSWLDLSSLDGTRGERTSTDATTWPSVGSASQTATMPGVVALRVDKSVVGTRGSRNGRMYLAGIPEEWTATGVTQTWTNAALGAWNGYLADFLNDINQTAGPDFQERDLVVIHTVGGAYGSVSKVLELTANPAVSTQVRRGLLR